MNRLIKRKTQIAERQSIIKKRLIAMTGNIKEVPANTSIGVFKSEYDKLIKDDWKILDINEEDSGIFGEFAYQFAGVGVNEPIIYLREIYCMTKKGGNSICFLVEHKYDTKGNIVKSDYEEYKDMAWRNLKPKLTSGEIQSIIDHCTVFELSGAETFNQAKEKVTQLMEEKNSNLQQ
jgi:hypothetical protein